MNLASLIEFGLLVGAGVVFSVLWVWVGEWE